MTEKLTKLVVSLLAISLLNQPCKATIFDTASTVISLYQFIELMVDRMLSSPKTADETLLAVTRMNTEVRNQLSEISKSLKDLPSIFDHVTQSNMLKEHIWHIGFVFAEAAKKHKDIKTGHREGRSSYINFRKEEEIKIDEDIAKIQSMLLDNTTTSFLTKTFTQGLKLYENVCVSGMSHMQLLYSLLAKFQVATAQYFVAKNMIFDFVEHFRKSSNAFNESRFNLRNRVITEYNIVVREFKKIMATASQEIWRCDAPKTTRYENKPESPYYKLMAFSKYMLNEGALAHPYCKTQCRDITKVDDCGNDASELCKTTRKCPNKLIGCDNLNSDHNAMLYLCVNSNTTATDRYTSLVPPSGNFSCPDGVIMKMRDYYIGDMYSKYEYCNFCQCICPEKIYYISTDSVHLEYEYPNVLMTGARLAVVDNTIDKTLYIQIQQGNLLPNGIVDPSSVKWKNIRTSKLNRVPITWEGIRSFDLTSYMLPQDEVVTGFALKPSKSDPKRIALELHSCKFNFRTGKVMHKNCFFSFENPARNSPKTELKLDDADVPTRSIEPNAPISNDDQYVTLTTTNMEKDAGQTTIPFIDMQRVAPNPPIPLSGAGLYLRGQEGFGGFLAIKLYTYNITSYVDEEFHLPEWARTP